MASTNPKQDISAILLIIIITVATLAYIISDMYTPSLPAITKELGVSSAKIQLTLAFFMFGFSISQLFYGPLSDRIGRRNPILIGVGLSVIGSLVCYFSPNAEILILGRLIQGLGVGACNSVGRTIARDLMSGRYLARFGSQLGMVTAFVTASAPTLGGYIQHYLNWRANFLILFIYTLLIWLLVWKKLPETNRYLNPEATKAKTMIKNYFTLFTHPTFIGFSLCSGIAFAGIIAFVTLAPFLLQNVVGLSPVQFGWLSFLIAASIVLSAFINAILIIKVGIPKMMLFGISIMFIAGIFMLGFAWFGYLNTFVILFPTCLFSLGIGFTFANAYAGALHPFPRMAGASAALFGCLQILGGALSSALMAKLGTDNQIPLGFVFIGLSVLSFLSLKFLAMRKSYKDI